MKELLSNIIKHLENSDLDTIKCIGSGKDIILTKSNGMQAIIKIGDDTHPYNILYEEAPHVTDTIQVKKEDDLFQFINNIFTRASLTKVDSSLH